MDDSEREQALLTALTTEHYALETARSGTIAEATGRATIYLSVLSAALIGLGFVASNEKLVRPYLGAVLPTLVVIGVLTFLRLVETTVENSMDLWRIQRIRAYYHHRFASQHDFFADAVQAEGTMRSAWTLVGIERGRWEFMLTTAALVGAVNSLLVGLGVALLVGLAGAGHGLAIPVGVVTALTAFAAQFLYILRTSAAEQD
ncbi:hypothetical protein DKT68_05090 [Micromonospora acroterricola]|uniref:Uncharacterized protein n=1 Tax=Micromonospora acroterricola TaxID=2202421 RepID=A0A317DFY1_9ACTN|nr:hypothetical protein [Micromonospora acroterricola]PWR11705.1 hypothetical protein DKT68_05090 [Micromonospora acroterricola]